LKLDFKKFACKSKSITYDTDLVWVITLDSLVQLDIETNMKYNL